MGGDQDQPFFVAVAWVADQTPSDPLPYRAQAAARHAAAAGVDFWQWRVALSPDSKDGIAAVRLYSFRELLEALIMLEFVAACRPEPEER